MPWSAFRRRLARHALSALSLIGVSLLAGTAGLYYCSQQPLVDAFLNAAMLLGGMGAVGEIRSTAGKLFAAAFALYAGLVFLPVAGILLVPVLHRLMHKVRKPVLAVKQRSCASNRREGPANLRTFAASPFLTVLMTCGHPEA